jgi:hypothetical protein
LCALTNLWLITPFTAVLIACLSCPLLVLLVLAFCMSDDDKFWDGVHVGHGKLLLLLLLDICCCMVAAAAAAHDSRFVCCPNNAVLLNRLLLSTLFVSWCDHCHTAC